MSGVCSECVMCMLDYSSDNHLGRFACESTGEYLTDESMNETKGCFVEDRDYKEYFDSIGE